MIVLSTLMTLLRNGENNIGSLFENVPVAPPVTTATRLLTVKRSAAAREGVTEEAILI